MKLHPKTRAKKPLRLAWPARTAHNTGALGREKRGKGRHGVRVPSEQITTHGTLRGTPGNEVVEANPPATRQTLLVGWQGFRILALAALGLYWGHDHHLWVPSLFATSNVRLWNNLVKLADRLVHPQVSFHCLHLLGILLDGMHMVATHHEPDHISTSACAKNHHM